jgi:RNA polymerase sigma-70 factor (ECF subfamily)
VTRAIAAKVSGPHPANDPDEAIMGERDWLAESFAQHRAHLRSVAYRILGSQTEADDAVQEAWLRISRSDKSQVDNIGGWLTTVVARLCLDMLRSRKARSETALADEGETEPLEGQGMDPEQEVMLANALGPALMIVLDALSPAERVAFVLHDLFAVSFEEIASILGRSPVAARQLASRGRRRVQGAAASSEADRLRQHELVAAFLAASRSGDFGALLAVLDPQIKLRADEKAVQMGAARFGLSSEIQGADTVANFFNRRALGARLALVDRVAAAVWAPGGRLRAVFNFKVAGDKIVDIHLVADGAALSRLDVVMLEEAPPAEP